MHRKIFIRLLTLFCLGILCIGLMSTKDFAAQREPRAKEDSAKSTEILEPKQVSSMDSTETKQLTETEMEKIQLEMIEEYRRIYLPFVPRKIEILEKNYKSTRLLEFIILDLVKARDLQALPVLIEVLSFNPRGINRARAADAIGIIEEYNGDDIAIPDLVQALDDTITDVQFRAAKALVNLGDTLNPVRILAKLARGEDKENWTVDWTGYMGLENMTEKEIEREKKKFKNRLQSKAIGLLGELSTKEAIAVLKELSACAEEETIKKHAQEALEKDLNESHQDIREPDSKNEKNGAQKLRTPPNRLP
jgi:hypothetical protein